MNDLQSGTIIFTLGGRAGAWTLSNGTNLLGATDNDLLNQGYLVWNDGTTTWTISIVNGVTTLATTDLTPKSLLFNTDTTEFQLTYYSSCRAITLYKKTNARAYSIVKNNEDKPQISMMFGRVITKSLYDELKRVEGTTFGILYSTTTNLGENTLQSLIASVNNGTITFNELSSTYHLSHKDLTNRIAGINEDGTVNASGSFYQLGVELTNINETKFNVEVTAACYVYYNGVYYLMNVKTYSVNSIANAYCTAANTLAYTNHLDMLYWLKSYKAN